MHAYMHGLLDIDTHARAGCQLPVASAPGPGPGPGRLVLLLLLLSFRLFVVQQPETRSGYL
jgi:hypothetical protein